MATDLRISNISKIYPGCIANDNVSLQFKSGKIYALLGENGAGKSTLVKILSGVISPDNGEVFLNEKNLKLSSPLDAKKNKIGMVFQHFNLFETLSVFENLSIDATEDNKSLRVKINEILNKLITDIKNEIDESEKLRKEAKDLLNNAQSKLDTAQSVRNEILEQAKKDSDRLIIDLNDKFHKSSEIKKASAENKIAQMKEAAIKEIKDASVKIAVDSVKKIITTSVDKSKLDNLFQKNLEETKEELKKINS